MATIKCNAKVSRGEVSLRLAVPREYSKRRAAECGSTTNAYVIIMEGERRIKGIAMVQWVNHLWNNIFVNPLPFILILLSLELYT